MSSVEIDLKELWGESTAEMFEIWPSDWNLKPISLKMSVCRHELGGGFNPQPADNSNPGCVRD